MQKTCLVCLALTLIYLLTGCDLSRSQEPPSPTRISQERDVLTGDTLLLGSDIQEPVDYAYLAPPEVPAPSSCIFEGRLELLGEAENGSIHYITGEEGATTETGHLPEFDFDFVQVEDHLVPVKRGLVITEHPDWDYILEPGQVWSEPGDEGWSRASLPFFLVAKGGNSNLAGVLTFIYSQDSISKVYYQVTQEITTYFRADMWGLLDASYSPGAVTDSDDVKAAFLEELNNRIPTRPIEQLSKDYPTVDVNAFVESISAPDLTTWGLMIDGTHYRSGCATRSGEYPYCEWVRLPSFSTAKTAFVGVALMRLEQQFGPGVSDLLIRDYLPEIASSPGDWSAVTFDNVLDMATGNYSSSSFMVDEESRIFSEFFGVNTYEEKIASALDWPHGTAPGTTWVYRSSDTFILVAAMQNFLEEKQGPQADIFQYVVEEIYKPLGIGPGFFTAARTSDNNWQGQPLGATGLWWLPDDIAKLGDFLNNSEGVWGGEHLLDRDLLVASLQRDARDRGVRMPGGMYNNSLWSGSFGAAQGFNCQFSVPYMAGYSGNIIALMPNGITFYYFSDHRDFDWASAVTEADKIIPFCQP